VKARVSRVGAIGFAVVALGALALASTSANGQANKELILGFPIALTGPINFFDGPFLNGAQLAVADINKRGGVLGMKLRIVTSDTKSQIPQGTVAANDVISKGAKFVFPTVDFDYGGAATRVASSKNLISMTQVGDPRYGLKGLGPLVFNIYQATPTEGAVTAQFIKQKKWTRPYLLTDTALNYTKTLCQFVKSSWKGSLAGESTFSNSDPSIASQISRMKSAKPDVIVLCSYPPGGATAVRQIRAAGLNIPIVGGVTMEGTYWLGNNTKENNFYATAGGVVRGDPNKVRARIFAAYKQRYGKLPPFSNAVLSGYSVVQAIAQAATSAKSIETAKVKAQLEKFRNVQLASGPTTWTPTCHVPLGRPYVIVKFSNGNPVPHYSTTVTPASVSRAIC
jgi:branched-chain amino acid transport system substrate-binding protein